MDTIGGFGGGPTAVSFLDGKGGLVDRLVVRFVHSFIHRLWMMWKYGVNRMNMRKIIHSDVEQNRTVFCG